MFLWVIGILNLLVLLDILKVWHTAKRELIATHISRRFCKGAAFSIGCSADASGN